MSRHSEPTRPGPECYTDAVGEVVWAVQFRGSSTQADALRAWSAGATYRPPSLQTRDWVSTEVAGATAHPGDYVVHRGDGAFAVIPKETFEVGHIPCGADASAPAGTPACARCGRPLEPGRDERSQCARCQRVLAETDLAWAMHTGTHAENGGAR